MGLFKKKATDKKVESAELKPEEMEGEVQFMGAGKEDDEPIEGVGEDGAAE